MQYSTVQYSTIQHSTSAILIALKPWKADEFLPMRLRFTGTLLAPAAGYNDVNMDIDRGQGK